MTEVHADVDKQSAVKRWLVLLGIWAVPALVFAGLAHAAMIRGGRPTVFWEWVGGQLAFWWTWALFTPLIVRLGNRYRLDRRPLGRTLVVHTIASIVLGVSQTCFAAFASIRIHGEPSTWEYYVGQLIPFLMWRGLWSVLVYWAILGVTYALEYRTRLNKRALEVSRLRSEITEARLDALQRQLQPHFLFNALNSVSVLIRAQRTDAADKTLGDLSELLRHVLGQQNSTHVTLENELNFTRRYAEIEETRFGDRLTVSIDAPDSLYQAHIPGFILQSLVENAIRHGVARKNGPGHVAINVIQNGNHLVATVADNGVGLTGSGRADGEEGIGLRNAHERLRHLYGDDYRLELRENPDGGVTTELSVPLQWASGDSES